MIKLPNTYDPNNPLNAQEYLRVKYAEQAKRDLNFDLSICAFIAACFFMVALWI